MCGIVGCIGQQNLIPFLLESLEKLEYRGYDSAGIAVHNGDNIEIYKAQGKLENLKNLLNDTFKNDKNLKSGIGHIRWATHGAPNQINAHPHSSFEEKVSIVHNGIIENYKELKKELTEKGFEFKSQTDTEVIAHLLEDCIKDENNYSNAIRTALKKLDGAYALGIIFKDNPEILYAARKCAPLILGVGEDSNFIASDVPALLDYTKRVIYLEDNQIAVIKGSSYQIMDIDGNILDKKPEILPWEPVTISKMGYKHFMLKEIHEQPDVIRQTLFDKLHTVSDPLVLKEVKLTKETLEQLDRIQIIACGTSLHAALVGKYLIEEFTGIPVDVEASSEYIYKRTVISKNSITIGVSQSGETADTLTAIRQAKDNGSHVLVITNRPDSTMARQADSMIPVNAGFEVSVAATKSYSAQLMAFYLLAIYLAEVKNTLSEEYIEDLKKELIQLPQKIEMILSNKDKIQDCAVKFHNTKNFIYIARGINYPVALEGALKLKEISYINATGYPAGELKHGPIAMLDETIPVLAILVPGKVYEKVLSNSEESKARNANMIAVTSEDNEHLEAVFDYIITIPRTNEVFSPILTTIPLQLLAYYIAEFLGKDIDQPRNLAKSVTVE
ncbi:MAG TPA: glutamine--fructose-6-phosphate transaminase (isomerizing) [Candidatus Gastranaerophilales bacterium]|nr:glutamine--fructose-6-phosphate transaminase (isomerizing) [Candidatus Gastranaerophilales bacterium]